jgi:hypothetical protein
VLQWRDEGVGKNDEAGFLAAYEKNTRQIWDVDEDAMVDGLVERVKGEWAKFEAGQA